MDLLTLSSQKSTPTHHLKKVFLPVMHSVYAVYSSFVNVAVLTSIKITFSLSGNILKLAISFYPSFIRQRFLSHLSLASLDTLVLIVCKIGEVRVSESLPSDQVPSKLQP